MTSYLNSLSGHVANIRRLIPTSMSPESDLNVNDTDDSHVSRVLRAYYTEKGRPFPPWLGTDPRVPQQAAPVYANALPSRGQAAVPVQSPGRNRRGLGDLFGDNSTTDQPHQESLSLRQPRRPLVGRTPASPAPQNDALPAARPLPSQRYGSYQSRSSTPLNSSSHNAPQPELDSRRAPSAQDRLKARFGGGGSTLRSESAASAGSAASSASGNRPRHGGLDNRTDYSAYGGRY